MSVLTNPFAQFGGQEGNPPRLSRASQFEDALEQRIEEWREHQRRQVVLRIACRQTSPQEKIRLEPVLAITQHAPEPVESEEMRWLVSNPDVLRRHAGEWLLIVRSRLVAHSRDFGEIRRAIQGEGIRSPFVYYVPTPEEANWVSI